MCVLTRAARYRRGATLFLFGLMATLGLPDAANAADPFEVLNLSFREQHAAAREREWAHHGPVILVEFELLTLIRGDARDVVEVIPAQYHQLKSIAHAPIAVYLALSGNESQPLDDRKRKDLNEIASRLESVKAILGTAKFGAKTLRRQEEIIDSSIAFIRKIIEAGSADNKALKAYATALAPLVMQNVSEAAGLQIRGYDDQIAVWKKSFSPDEWNTLKVVVVGSALPRKQNLAIQYFAKVLGVPEEGPRLIYAESLYEEAKALKLLTATAVDAKAGAAFFDDPSRLHRDLMDQAAAKYLSEHASELTGIHK